MRHLVVLALALAMLVGCGGAKKPAANPGNGSSDSANEPDKEEDINTPTDPDDPAAKSADPCEGGE